MTPPTDTLTPEEVEEAMLYVKWLLAEAFSAVDELCETVPLDKFSEFSDLRKKLAPILEAMDK